MEQTHRQDRLGIMTMVSKANYMGIPKHKRWKNWNREIEFSERGIHRVRTKVNRIQQDLLLTPTVSLTGIKPKQLLR